MTQMGCITDGPTCYAKGLDLPRSQWKNLSMGIPNQVTNGNNKEWIERKGVQKQ